MKRLQVWMVVAVIIAYAPVLSLEIVSMTSDRGQAFGAERVDNVTQRSGMHSCPVGNFVTGTHLDDNLLLCSDDFGGYRPQDESVDRGTVRRGWHPEGAETVHACPEGMAVTGIHWNRSLLACAPIRRIRSLFIDKKMQRQGMHACPVGTVLVGFNTARNWLLCGMSESLTTEQRNSMLSCRIGWFVIGVHVERNRLMCSAAFSGYTQSDERVDSSTMRVVGDRSLRGCPEGMAMTGIHVNRNLRACAPISNVSTGFIDFGRTQRANMIACPLGSAAVGYDLGGNLLMCVR